ncbi:hypothetical protein [Chelativorans sp. AA-79]|uniref:hypothetical protein n=1 Tax=Chelativorans sp. AA-79 TaxID=3028735 RepID=UPI0023FA059D|nr:hypothetical protein [Chelativorans sp. AA-79]WEX10284.1 hypothetical protein PVE73_04815 [Chelativorans sp. AA-79]
MARATWRHAFDRDRDFIVRRQLTIGGKTFAPGEPFDKTLVPTRRLRQLFDSHRIIYTDVPKPGNAKRSMLEPRRAPAPRHDPKPSAPPQGAEPVEIPEDWASKPFLAIKAIAKQIKPDLDAKAKKPEIVAIIEAEITRRAGGAQTGPKSPETPENRPSEGGGQPVEIPEDWRELPVEERIALAMALTGETIGTDEDAAAAIELAIESRAEMQE